MKQMTRILVLTGLAVAVVLSASNLAAQGQPAQGDRQGGNRGQGGGPGGGRGNFDRAEFQQRMMDNLREQFQVKDDAEWKIISERIIKVNEVRLAAASSGGMGRMFRRPGGDSQGGAPGGGPGGGRGGFGGEASAEEQALNKAIDNKATKAELKTAMDKYRESRKAKQAELEKLQDELKQLLNTQQEALALTMGLVR